MKECVVVACDVIDADDLLVMVFLLDEVRDVNDGYAQHSKNKQGGKRSDENIGA